MLEVVVGLGLLLSIFGALIYASYRERKTGRDQQKLDNAEEAIENVKKANNAASDSSFDDELQQKYGRK
jgi:hypothetical protein